MTPKKLHRFFIQTVPSETSWDITDERIAHHIVSVLKLSVGESFIVFTDHGPDVTVTITDKDKRSLSVTVIDTKDTPALPRTIIAAISIPKGTSFELAVQKLTEVGASVIVPIISERTIKQAVRIDRLQKISDEALEQSGGNVRVTIHEPMTLRESLTLFPFMSIVCDAYSTTAADTALPDTVVMYVGPEGGWSEGDEEVFAGYTTSRLALGSKILRTETAAIIGTHTLLWHS